MRIYALREKTRPKKSRRNRKDQGFLVLATEAYRLVFKTLKIQLPTLIAIAASELLMRHAADGTTVVVLVVLSVVIYTAQTAGVRQGLLSAALVVVYDYYVILTSAPGVEFNLETLQRGALIGVAFPIVAFAIGRLKERNDALLQREKTERKKAEESERRLRFVAESVPQKIFTATPSGKINYLNSQWEECAGGWPESIHPDDTHENTELWRHSLETGEPFQFEHRLKRKDGTYIWHITRIHALYNDADEIIGWVGSSTDTEDIKKTRKLEASTAKLIKQRTQLMELNTAKDEFISLASHQLRTPATGVKQYLNMALDGYGGDVPAKLQTFLEKANESNERQLSVINDLLQVAQMDAGKVVLRKEDVDVGKLIADTIREQKSKFSLRNQNVSFKKPKRAVLVLADATKLRMVIENIIDNASKYTPRGKNVTIRLTQSHGMAHVTIKDEGVGIAGEDIERVFQKFIRLDNPMSTQVGGTGLGLYWVQKVVELHDGSVTVSSKIGEGSTFMLSLPLS